MRLPHSLSLLFLVLASSSQASSFVAQSIVNNKNTSPSPSTPSIMKNAALAPTRLRGGGPLKVSGGGDAAAKKVRIQAFDRYVPCTFAHGPSTAISSARSPHHLTVCASF